MNYQGFNMGVRYCNILIHGVTQSELCKRLASYNLDVYVSPNINDYVILYPNIYRPYLQFFKNLYRNVGVNPDGRRIWKQYFGYSPLVWSVSLASLLSWTFRHPVMSVYADEDWGMFWYHLSECGDMVDEYTTLASPDWHPGQGIKENAEMAPKGGTSLKLCQALRIDRMVSDVESILRKPCCYTQYEDLASRREVMIRGDFLSLAEYDFEERHEALAVALNILPRWWVIGIDYLCFEGSGDFGAVHSDYFVEGDPTCEEALAMIKKT
ncbi:MAG: hypothetical protein F6K16_42110 [Symploca sp. SIO2B6]|nr:hypothetical protein [Symploca sp. SIO2B6]